MVLIQDSVGLPEEAPILSGATLLSPTVKLIYHYDKKCDLFYNRSIPWIKSIPLMVKKYAENVEPTVLHFHLEENTTKLV